MAITDDSIKKNISQNITKYREKAGLSQKELARRLEVTPSRVSNWEQGANCPTIEILFEVCKILNVSINDIYGVYPDLDMKLSYEEKQYLDKYRFISKRSPDGIEAVNYILNREYKIAEQIGSMENHAEETVRFASSEPEIKAAHNDYEADPEEQEKMYDDLSNLKRPT